MEKSFKQKISYFSQSNCLQFTLIVQFSNNFLIINVWCEYFPTEDADGIILVNNSPTIVQIPLI